LRQALWIVAQIRLASQQVEYVGEQGAVSRFVKW
jgi:hypothetical protein